MRLGKIRDRILTKWEMRIAIRVVGISHSLISQTRLPTARCANASIVGAGLAYISVVKQIT